MARLLESLLKTTSMARRKGSVPHNFEDLSGRVFGRLAVVNPGSRLNGRFRWVCICSCGTSKEIEAGNLRTGRQSSCGCLNDALRRQRNDARRVSEEHRKAGSRLRGLKWSRKNWKKK